MAKKTGIRIPANFAAFDRRVIVLDKDGVPWVISPDEGTISLAKIVMPDDKQSAVKRRK
jgi:hypothetical protein